MSGDPSFSSTTTSPDQLLAGEFPRVAKDVTIKQSASLSRGAVLGKLTNDTVPTTGTADGGNTGNGTMTSVTGGAETKPGTYTVVCIEAVADGGIFQVLDPDGFRVGENAVVGSAYTSAHLNFTLNDGATDFAVGDKFTVAVTGSGKYILSASAATDGSQKARAILAKAVDASAADKEGPVYLTGEFNEAALSFGTGHDADSVRDDLEDRGIYLKTTVAA